MYAVYVHFSSLQQLAPMHPIQRIEVKVPYAAVVVDAVAVRRGDKLAVWSLLLPGKWRIFVVGVQWCHNVRFRWSPTHRAFAAPTGRPFVPTESTLAGSVRKSQCTSSRHFGCAGEPRRPLLYCCIYCCGMACAHLLLFSPCAADLADQQKRLL